MKYALVLCLLSASFMKLTTGQGVVCTQNCRNTYLRSFQAAGSDPLKICRAVETLVNCFQSICHAEVPSTGNPVLDKYIKDGIDCESSSSRALSTTLLIAVSLLLAAYKTFHL